MEPHCPVLVTEGVRCPKHARLHEDRDRQRRGSAAERGYDREWQAARDAYAKVHPWCERHLRRGVRRRTQIVDHRHPVKQGGARLDPANFEAQCRSCHALKSYRDGSYGSESRDKAPSSKENAGRESAGLHYA